MIKDDLKAKTYLRHTDFGHDHPDDEVSPFLVRRLILVRVSFSATRLLLSPPPNPAKVSWTQDSQLVELGASHPILHSVSISVSGIPSILALGNGEIVAASHKFQDPVTSQGIRNSCNLVLVLTCIPRPHRGH